MNTYSIPSFQAREVSHALAEPSGLGAHVPNASNFTLDFTDETAIYLAKLAAPSEWFAISQPHLVHEDLPGGIKHILLDGLMVKAHDPAQIFTKVRASLSKQQYFAFKVTTAENIKNAVKDRYPAYIFKIYYIVHFLGRRVLPKLKGLRKLSRLLGIPVDMSKSEIMGRLIYHGFDLVHILENPAHTLFIAQPHDDVAPSSYAPLPKEGVLFSMQRMGKNNKPITVYKFRSMHPYAEYAQSYMHRTNGLDAGGKFKNDYRVSTGGRIIRKYWIDELPMLYNLLRGDIKLIGVRPISAHYFSLYPENLRAIRPKYKPGLLPPFYADLPKDFEEIVQSELRYLESYEKAPFKTDMAYLEKILKNIFYHKARSQ
ncbi:sugar transferase [Persicitalea sp.]|uniref:sugar transferase n=1 Tax=Persicitalea sp. TaxID=3100273 RepID=UPI0035936D0B